MTESSNSGAGENAAAAQPIEGTVMTPEQLAALAAIAGNIKVSITLANGTTYNLAASVPTAATDPYTFKLDEVAGSATQTLADFKVVDSSNFSVTVNLPTITAGGTKINGGFNLVATPPSPEQGQIEA
ncbi:MAG TPA: hypothetical protein VN767_13035 [Streptosporangiaceae bacterium]|jgi:acetylornithine deacetylase/succinyl-diaminopimelate desuccinylase-like protein|nr:hypothetical protein [Streptosporangiaceae bacterium]